VPEDKAVHLRPEDKVLDKPWAFVEELWSSLSSVVYRHFLELGAFLMLSRPEL
jgi:hypothetical protein